MTKAAALLALILLGGCSGSTAPPAAGGCSAVQSSKAQGQSHIVPPAKGSYNTDPATSGEHYPAPAATGVYTTDGPEPEQLVHNLEHGHVVIWVIPGKLPESVFGELATLVHSNGTRIVLVPRPTPFPDPAAVLVSTAWGHFQACSDATSKMVSSVRAFVSAYAGKGPEGDIAGKPRTA